MVHKWNEKREQLTVNKYAGNKSESKRLNKTHQLQALQVTARTGTLGGCRGPWGWAVGSVPAAQRHQCGPCCHPGAILGCPQVNPSLLRTTAQVQSSWGQRDRAANPNWSIPAAGTSHAAGAALVEKGDKNMAKNQNVVTAGHAAG